MPHRAHCHLPGASARRPGSCPASRLEGRTGGAVRTCTPSPGGAYTEAGTSVETTHTMRSESGNGVAQP
eukprot:3938352-Rhodomonas_salina.1